MTPTASATLPVAIGVGFDTARYGHHVTFLDQQLQHLCKPTDFAESHAGYQRLRQLFDSIYQRFPTAEFLIRIDAAGQYATNLETFLRQLPFPKSLSLGDPLRNQNYRKAIFPKQKTDPAESLCAARFALRERPAAAPAVPEALVELREIVARVESQTRLVTRLTNQLHNLLARVFPELACHVPNLKAAWVLRLLDAYPTPARIANAKLASLTRIPHLTADKASAIQATAAVTVASLTGPVAAELVQELVRQLRRSAATTLRLKHLMTQAYEALPPNHLDSILGIGAATAAVLTAKMIRCDRFATPNHLVSYFGVCPERETSGVEPDGSAKLGRHLPMSRKGNDLVRKYLWNAAKTAIVHNPAVRALYRRLRRQGTRGDVALGHAMRKLLHLVFAVWSTGRPFDPHHYPWEATPAGDEKTAGHNQGPGPEGIVVTAASPTITPEQPQHNHTRTSPEPHDGTCKGEGIDFAALRSQVSIEQVLTHLGCFRHLHGTGLQKRGPCPVHGGKGPRQRSFSVHLGKNLFQCFHPPCAAKGNALDLWAAVHHLSLFQAALDLARTFNLTVTAPGNREEEPVKGTRKGNP